MCQFLRVCAVFYGQRRQAALATDTRVMYSRIMSDTYSTDALKTAIRRAGGATRLGAALGITRQAVEQWVVVPAERVLAVERETGVSRYALRPDIYGPPPTPKQRAAYQPAA